MSEDYVKYKNKKKIIRIIFFLFTMYLIISNIMSSQLGDAFRERRLNDLVYFFAVCLVVYFLVLISQSGIKNTKFDEFFYLEGDTLIIEDPNAKLPEEITGVKKNGFFYKIGLFFDRSHQYGFPLHINLSQIKELNYKNNLFIIKPRLDIIWLNLQGKYNSISLYYINKETKDKIIEAWNKVKNKNV